MKLPTKGKNLVKFAQWLGHLYAKIVVKCSVLGPHTHPRTDWGEISREGVDLQATPPRQISAQSVQRVAPAGENFKIAPWVTGIPTLCAAHNAAGDNNIHICMPL